MKAGIKLAALVPIAAALLLLASLGPREKPGDAAPVTASGILRLVGSEPFTRLVLSSPDGKNYFFEDADKAGLRPFLGKKIRVQGLLRKKPVRTADGKSLGDELLLLKIRVETVPE